MVGDYRRYLVFDFDFNCNFVFQPVRSRMVLRPDPPPRADPRRLNPSTGTPPPPGPSAPCASCTGPGGPSTGSGT